MIDIRFCVSNGLFVLQMQKLSDSLSRVQNPGWLFYIYKGIILYTTQLYRVYNKPPKSIPINQSVYWNVKPRVQSQGSRPKPCAKIITWNPTKTYQKHKGFVFFVGCPAKHSCQEKNSPLHFKAMNFLTLRGFFRKYMSKHGQQIQGGSFFNKFTQNHSKIPCILRRSWMTLVVCFQRLQ